MIGEGVSKFCAA